jgi:hypothetical protein
MASKPGILRQITQRLYCYNGTGLALMGQIGTGIGGAE